MGHGLKRRTASGGGPGPGRDGDVSDTLLGGRPDYARRGASPNRQPRSARQQPRPARLVVPTGQLDLRSAEGPAAYPTYPPRPGAPQGYTLDPGRRRPPARSSRPRRFIDYPRWNRFGWTRWIPSWKLIFAFFGLGVVTAIGGLYAAYSATGLPAPDAQAIAQTTVIYYSDGKTPIAQLATQNRQSVSLEQVPKDVQNAVLAAEDRTFRTNSGIEPTSIARAALSNLRGNSRQGGSTISQQYLKNIYNERDRSVRSKAQEILMAVKMNQVLTKDDILSRYLNTIYFGRDAYGIQAAAHAYFGRSTDAIDLSVSQAAFLAGIINAPSLADPRGGPEEKARAVRRWEVVLDAMVAEKWLDPTVRQGLKFPATIEPVRTVTTTGQNGYLKDMVVKEATETLKISEDRLMSAGYKITTTFNRGMMRAGVEAVEEMLPEDRPKGLNIGMTSIDPSTGAVRAIFGGTKYVGPENNNATIARAQGGSTFKPFGLIAALEDGVSLRTEYQSDSPVTVRGQSFRNSDEGESSGSQDLIEATERSLNTVYAQLNDEVGPERMAEAAYAAGIPKNVPIAEEEVGNVLGSADLPAIDMASAYATFAANGIRRKPYTIQTISHRGSKRVLHTKDGKTDGTRAFEADNVADLTHALQQVVRNGTGSYAQRVGRPVAGKTGTSTNSRSAWFVGYTPLLSTSVVMYQLGTEKNEQGERVASNVPMEGFGEFEDIFGGGYPTMIWTEFMELALRGTPDVTFPEPVFGGDTDREDSVVITPGQP
jgi:membrane peptidoglycan carboxypeptidase